MRYWQASQGLLIAKILIGLNLAVFVATAAIDSRALNGSLTRLQVDLGLNSSLVAQGPTEWYRIVSSGFIHFGLLHIAFNMYVLFALGPTLERILGHVRFTALYLLSALGGAVASYFFSDITTVSVGASGAIFGLMGALVVAGRRLRYDVTQVLVLLGICLLYTSPSPRDRTRSRMPSSA